MAAKLNCLVDLGRDTRTSTQKFSPTDLYGGKAPVGALLAFWSKFSSAYMQLKCIIVFFVCILPIRRDFRDGNLAVPIWPRHGKPARSPRKVKDYQAPYSPADLYGNTT
jgi:hypothetical protein